MPRAAILWTLALAAALGINGGELRCSVAPAGIVSFELAGTTEAAAAIVAAWRAVGAVDDAWLSLWIDMPFLVLYGYTIAQLCDEGPPAMPAWATELGWWFARAAVLAAVLDVVENALLMAWLAECGLAWSPALTALIAAVKFTLVVPAAAYGVLVWVAWGRSTVR